MSTKSPIAAALAQLQLERANLAARLAKVDEAIATLGDLFHVPTLPAPARRTRNARIPTHTNGTGATSKGDTTKDAIRAALARGAMTPADLAGKVGLKRPALLYHTAQMKKAGVLVTTGKSASIRYALAGRSAKEAP